jgi:7,8-dihydropterin-6-yl-methyl-4-(beta-D-ribofuranosyl)aminobenzene 5'-phosphate synthase
MPKNLFDLWFVTLTITLTISNGATAYAAAQNPALRVTVLFNNVFHLPGLTPGWGFSCLVEGLGKTILFDTGADGGVLLDNMKRLNLDPGRIDAVFLSHIHGDHTGGLDALLARQPGVQVFLPAGFPDSFRQAVDDRGAKVILVRMGGRLMDHVYSTGEFDDGIVEQAMIVETEKGLVVITGCAHPGIARIAETAIRLTGKKIHLLMGGFHLGGTSRSEIQAIVSRLQSLGVEKVGPSHCTGDAATALFRQAWGKNFVEAGLGAVIELPLR